MSTTDSGARTTWLSQDAYDRLQAELNELIANRPVLAAEINARREEGDLRENGGYHAAREEQGKQEARIRYLQELLRNAKVGEPPKGDVVAPGTVVTIYFDDDADDTRDVFARFPRDRRDHRSHRVQPGVRARQAILGARPGQTVTYTAPSGAEIKVTVVKIRAVQRLITATRGAAGLGCATALSAQAHSPKHPRGAHPARTLRAAHSVKLTA